MATLQDLKDAYIAATGSYPPRLDSLPDDTPVTDQDLVNVRNTYGGGTTTSGTTNVASDATGNVTAADILAIFAQYGVEAATATESADQRASRIAAAVNSGARTIGEVTQTIQGIGSGAIPNLGNPALAGTGQGTATVPDGATLVAVTNPTGSDADRLYYLVYSYGTARLAFEVGDIDRLNSLFGGPQAFDNYQTVTQAGFDNARYVPSGPVDDILGSTGSFASQIELSLRAAGMEDIPSWMRNDPQALALVAEATSDEWSAGKLWVELSKTAGFAQRFGAIDTYLQPGVTVQQAVDSYVQDESALRNVIRRYKPAGTVIDTDYLARVMQSGWSASQASAVLAATQNLVQHPESLAEANLVMAASGLPTLDETAMVNVLTGGSTPDVVEALNTAAAGVALAQAGLGDVDVDLLTKVVDDTSRLRTAEDYQQLARQLATQLMANTREIDQGKMGLSEEDVVAAAFGRESPSGKTLGETLNLLTRFEAERRTAAQGFAGTSSFIDDKGKLRIQGFKGL